MPKHLVAANWKMNASLERNRALVEAILRGVGRLDCEVALCVPYPYLAQVAGLIAGSGLGLAAQDLSAHASGAYTGEVSAGMLRDLGCSHVIVGHSERRRYHAETDAVVLGKVRQALGAGLVPILCVGESLAERQGGESERVVLKQIEAVFAGLDDASATRIAVAYEPVWAIGSGLAATPEVAQDMHRRIRGALAARLGAAAGEIPLIYGGSVSAENAEALFAMEDIDGGLVGGASLDAANFLAICAACAAR